MKNRRPDPDPKRAGDPLAESALHVDLPIEPSLDPSLRVLSLPLTALYEAPIPIGALAGLPAGMLDIASANLLIAATPCDPPLFGMKMEDACTRFGRDVMLVRTGLFPETMNPVTVDVALVGRTGPSR